MLFGYDVKGTDNKRKKMKIGLQNEKLLCCQRTLTTEWKATHGTGERSAVAQQQQNKQLN